MVQVADTEGGPPSFRGVFIRAPAIVEVGPEVEVLAEVPLPSDKLINSDISKDSQEVRTFNSYALSCGLNRFITHTYIYFYCSILFSHSH